MTFFLPILSTDYKTLCRWKAQTQQYWRVRLTLEEVSLSFPSEKQVLINQNPILNSISCKVKQETDLCSLVERHLRWLSWDDLCHAGRMQQTSMKWNTPLMDIRCGSLTPKCHNTLLGLPSFLSPFQSWEWSNTGSLFESPCSSACVCIIHGLVATHTHPQRIVIKILKAGTLKQHAKADLSLTATDVGTSDKTAKVNVFLLVNKCLP